jgi:hypothetical protein
MPRISHRSCLNPRRDHEEESCSFVAGHPGPCSWFGDAGSKNPVVGGQEMYPTNDIIDKDVNAPDHTTLENAVKGAGLVHWLKGPGPFTVFASSNEAFANREPVEAGE